MPRNIAPILTGDPYAVLARRAADQLGRRVRKAARRSGEFRRGSRFATVLMRRLMRRIPGWRFEGGSKWFAAQADHICEHSSMAGRRIGTKSSVVVLAGNGRLIGRGGDWCRAPGGADDELQLTPRHRCWIEHDTRCDDAVQQNSHHGQQDCQPVEPTECPGSHSFHRCDVSRGRRCWPHSPLAANAYPPGLRSDSSETRPYPADVTLPRMSMTCP